MLNGFLEWLIVSDEYFFILFLDVPMYTETSLGRVSVYVQVASTLAEFLVIFDAPLTFIDNVDVAFAGDVVKLFISPVLSVPLTVAWNW